MATEAQTRTIESIKATLKNYKLDPVVKTDWLEALRSGKYIQGHFRLKIPGDETGPECHCAMGVCGEAADRLLEENVDLGGGEYLKVYTDKDGKSPFSLDYDFIPHEIQYPIMNLNDNIRLSFNEIADIIEECL
jgi:hypothetical protein